MDAMKMNPLLLAIRFTRSSALPRRDLLRGFKWFMVVYLCLGCVVAKAAVIYDNMARDEFDIMQSRDVGWANYPPSIAVGFAKGARYTISDSDYFLDSVSLPLQHTDLLHQNLAISIVEDLGGLPGGPVLERLATDPANIPSSAAIVTFTSSLNPVLAAGHSYWLVHQPARLNILNQADNTFYDWWINYDNAYGLTGIRDFNSSTYQWNDWQVFNGPQQAFRVEGTLIPEPGTVALLLSAGVGWLFFRRLGQALLPPSNTQEHTQELRCRMRGGIDDQAASCMAGGTRPNCRMEKFA